MRLYFESEGTINKPICCASESFPIWSTLNGAGTFADGHLLIVRLKYFYILRILLRVQFFLFKKTYCTFWLIISCSWIAGLCSLFISLFFYQMATYLVCQSFSDLYGICIGLHLFLQLLLFHLFNIVTGRVIQAAMCNLAALHCLDRVLGYTNRWHTLSYQRLGRSQEVVYKLSLRRFCRFCFHSLVVLCLATHWFGQLFGLFGHFHFHTAHYREELRWVYRDRTVDAIANHGGGIWRGIYDSEGTEGFRLYLC